jgi:hypothetical protein
MYALFSHPLLMPIIPMGQLNRKGDKAVKQGFANVFFLFPSPPQKRVKERVDKQGGLLEDIVWGGGLLPIRVTFEKPLCCLPHW